MEKKSINLFFFQKKKILHYMMQMFVFLFYTSIFGVPSNDVFSQKTVIKIDVDKTVSVDEIFDIIREQTEFTFIYQEDLFKDVPKIHLKKGTILANELLQKSLANGNFIIEFNDSNNTILIKEKTIDKQKSVPIIEKQKDTPTIKKQQDITINGTVTDSQGGPLVGATILAMGTTVGTITDFDGKFELTITEDVTTLVVSYLGFATKEVAINNENTFEITLFEDSAQLDEVVITGVITGTSKKKLAFTVAKIKAEDLQQTTSGNAVQALSGKVAGVRVVQSGGQPGSEPSIRLRGATSLTGSQAPLIIIDGIITEGSISDINPDDVVSMEVIKDAAAASLYGSRAANGVIQIFTKRGSELSDGETKILLRNEFGFSTPGVKYPLATHHPFQLEANGQFALDGSGNRILDADGLADNAYPKLYDQQDLMYDNGTSLTNYLSIAKKNGGTNWAATASNYKEQGILRNTDGYNRQTLRLNIDHKIGSKLDISVSTQYIESKGQNIERSKDSPFYTTLVIPPDIDLTVPNLDGTPYIYNPVPDDDFGNPLYEINNRTNDTKRVRQLAGADFKYKLNNWMHLSGNASLDREQRFDLDYFPRGYLSLREPALAGGLLTKRHTETKAINSSLTALIFKEFGDLYLRVRPSILFENLNINGTTTEGRNFVVDDTPSLNAASIITATSFNQDIRSTNFFTIASLDFKGRYIGDVLFRRDGSSLFGADERYANYFRVSGAYRISEEPWFKLKGIEEFKLRASYGTAGLRPPFEAQYETLAVIGGSLQFSTLGNTKLKPAVSRATELGFDIDFLNRFSLGFSYAKNEIDDQILKVPLASAAGFPFQWQNAGSLESETLEAQLNAAILRNKDFKWNLQLTFDRTKQKVTKLKVAPFLQSNVLTSIRQEPVGPAIFLVQEGVSFGTMVGRDFARNFDQVPQLLDASGSPIPNENSYMINEDGYVVLKSTYGTSNERPIALLDADGQIASVEIGNVNPDFQLGIYNNFNYKNWSASILLDWKQGGDIYNNTRQNLYETPRHGDVDQFDKPLEARKPVGYYQTLYATNSSSSHFIEDGTYLKLREIAINYRIKGSSLGSISDHIEGITFGITGRNLFTVTNYSGFDPEVGASDATLFPYDNFSYPNFRKFTFNIAIEF
jgi:TonB-linked SusC/RagA family outer membrane protein